MTEDYDADQTAEKLRSVSTDVEGISAYRKREDGIQPFHFWTTRLLTTDEMISLCREMAVVIRRDIPERPDGWAARLLPGNLPMRIMGDYYVGWAGRADEWHLREGQERKATDGAEWLALRERLRALLIARGRTEGTRSSDGEFYVEGDESGRYSQTLYIRQPEFLTAELIVAIQNVLRDGYAHWVVDVTPAFGPAFESLSDGIEVRADSVEEEWDRHEAEKLLGERLKI